MTIVLVSCVSMKLRGPAAAQDLYISPLFKGMRRYAEQNGDSWYILSAKYHVLKPDEVIKTYDCSLNTMPRIERLAWAECVKSQLLELLPANAEVIILAGVRYRKNIIPFLEGHGFHPVKVPMEGKKIGQQLSWLKENTH